MRDTDPAADAAWADRMDGLWNACHYLTGWIERDKLLSPIWTPETAVDLLWMMILHGEESLCNERGWSKDAYVKRLEHTIQHALTTMKINT